MFENFESIVCLDVETTGLNPRTDRVIELGAIKTPALGQPPTEEISRLVRLEPGVRLPGRITEITGITDRMLAERGTDRRETAQALAGMLEGRNLVMTYNAQFDMCFIYYMLYGIGRQEVLAEIKMLDLLTVYRDRRPYPHRLENAVEVYRLPAVNSHRAVDDADAALKLAQAMAREREDLDRYINLFGYIPKFGAPKPRIGSVTYLPQPYDSDVPLYERLETAGSAR